MQVEWFIPAFERWREEMGLHQPFTLVGHSMGAMLATEWARVHPSRIRKLVSRTVLPHLPILDSSLHLNLNLCG